MRNPTTGAVAQADCASETGAGCDFQTDGLDSGDGVAVSPDGAKVYVASDRSGITVLTRAADGSVTPAGCLKDPADAGDLSCLGIAGFQGGGARAVVVSSDSKYVYVSTQNGNAIAEFQRSGASLTYLGCVSDPTGGTGNATCAITTAHGLSGVNGLALSPSGDRLYTVSYAGNALAVFNRNPSTGLLTGELGCVSLVSGGSGEPLCSTTTVPGLGNARSVAVSGDGARVYTTSLDGALDSFATQATVPGVAPLGCVGAAPPHAPTPGCARNDGVGLAGAGPIVLVPGAPAGTVGAYVTGFFDRAVAELEVDPATGALVPLPAPDGCIAGATSATSCAGPLAHGLVSADGIAISPDGGFVYVASRGAAARPCSGGKLPPCTDTIGALAAFSRFVPTASPPTSPPPGPTPPSGAPQRPSNAFSILSVRASKTGAVTLRIGVGAAGAVSVKATFAQITRRITRRGHRRQARTVRKTIRYGSASGRAVGPGVVVVTLRRGSTAARLLSRLKRLRLLLAVSFDPTGGTVNSRTRGFTVAAPRPRRPRRR